MKALKIILPIMLLLFILNNKSIAQWTADPSLNTEISSASGEQAIPKLLLPLHIRA